MVCYIYSWNKVFSCLGVEGVPGHAPRVTIVFMCRSSCLPKQYNGRLLTIYLACLYLDLNSAMLEINGVGRIFIIRFITSIIFMNTFYTEWDSLQTKMKTPFRYVSSTLASNYYLFSYLIDVFHFRVLN